MKIFKGDDTGGRLGKALTITVHTKYDLTDCLVFFNYQGITRKWEGVKDGDTLDLFFSHNETARMSVGTFKGTMFAVDPAGKYRTIDNAIPITVTTSLRDCYGDDHFDVVVGVAINWDDIVHKPFEGQEIDIGTDDKVLAALGTIIEKLGGTVKAGIALVALYAMSAFGYTPDTHNHTYTTNGVTYAQRGGLGAATYVVTNIAMTASDIGAYSKDETDAKFADKRDKDDLAVYEVVRTENTDWTWTSENKEFAHDFNEAGTKPEWNGHAWWYVNLPSNYSINMPVEIGRSVTSITYDVSKIEEIPVVARCTATRPRYMDETLGPAKTDQQLAAVATGDAQTPANS